MPSRHPWWIAMAVALMPATAVGGQEAPQPLFRSSARLVVEIVTVTRPDGTPVAGLTADDFRVTENGVPQQVAFVDYQQVDAFMQEAPERQGAAPSSPPPAGRSAGTGGGRRLVALYFDLSAMRLSDQLRAYGSARTFVDLKMRPYDAVAILTFQGGAVRTRLDFTNDKGLLREAIQVLTYGDDLDGDGLPDHAMEGGAFGQNEVAFNIFNTDRQLAALQTAVETLGSLPEPKALVYFGSGIRLGGSRNRAQLRATVNAAVRANVSLNPIDARGLVASAPLGDATRPSPGAGNLFRDDRSDGLANADRTEDVFYALAADTGGRALLNYNDLSFGIAAAAARITSYYAIGYYSSNAKDDGTFRRVRVMFSREMPGALRYREGYYANKSFESMSASDKERQLEEALMLGNPITDVPVAMETSYFRLNRDEYYVPVTLAVPGSELGLSGRRSARTVVDVIGEIKDRYGTTIQNVRDRIDVDLTVGELGRLKDGLVRYQTGFTLLPDDYVIKVLVRDATSGRIGTYETEFTVPDVSRSTGSVPVSSVVMGVDKVPTARTLYTVEQQVDASDVDPLVHDGERLLPSPTRAFSRSRQLYLLVEAYPVDVTTARTLLGYVSLYKDGLPMLEASPVVQRAQQGAGSRVAFRFTVALDDVSTGLYTCQVTVLDSGAEQAAFWRTSIAITP